MTTDTSVDQLRQALAMRDRQIDAVHRISSALFSQTDLSALLRESLHVFLDTVGADAGSIWLFDREKRKIICRHHYRGNDAILGREIDPDDRTANVAIVLRTGMPLISEFGLDPTGYEPKNLLTVPLKNLGGEPIGVMQALNKRVGKFTMDDQDLMEIVSSLAATSIVNTGLAEEAKLAAVARAVGDLGHDIKNALTPVESMVDTTIAAFIEPMYESLDHTLAEWETKEPELAVQVRAATQSLRDWYPEVDVAVKDGCGDIREMVSEIADYIKGAQATHIVPNSIKCVIDERLRRLKVVAGNRRVTLHVDEVEDVPPFPFDRRLMGRAVYNLVNNALGAIDAAVKEKTLTLRMEGFNVWVSAYAVPEGVFPDGAFCKIKVRDDGPGIPDRVLKSLFTQQAISTTPGGTGIGTRFVRSVADAHGGQVGVESELGHGARFWIKIPLTQGAESQQV